MEIEYRVYESDKGTQRASRECHMETEVNYIVRKTVFVRCEIFHKNGFLFLCQDFENTCQTASNLSSKFSCSAISNPYNNYMS